MKKQMKSKQPAIPHIRSVGMVGAGLMGAGIAAVNIRNHYHVWVYDANPRMLETLPDRVRKELNDEDESSVEYLLQFLHPCSLEQLASCDLVMEVIPEVWEAKRDLYATLNTVLPEPSLLVSNTSTIPIERLSQWVTEPRYFAGLHFLHPVRFRELVEVIPSSRTCEQVIQRLCDYVLALEKTPLCVGDCPGFVVNRLLQPYLNEGMLMLQEGVSMELLERSATSFGMAWGPLRVMDEIGLDVVLHSGRVLYEAYPERVRPSPILISMVKKKLLGRKAGKGFYDWGEDWEEHQSDHTFRPRGFCDATQELVDQWMNETLVRYSGKEIAARLATAMAMEGGRIIMDDVVSDQGQIDMAAVIGLGFPEAKRGPLAWFAKEVHLG